MEIPIILEISTVVGCQMMCDYCPQQLHVKQYSLVHDKKHRMSFETFKTCVDKVPTNVKIVFAGMAEPWLNFECTDMVLYAHNRGHQTAVFTTCSGMTLEDFDRFKHVPFTHFCIHLPDAHGRMNMAVTEEYLNVVEACRQIQSHNLMVIGELHPDVRARVGHVSDGDHSLISRGGNLKDKLIQRKTGKLRCTACGPRLDHNVMIPNGDVGLCCMDYGLKHTLGNLLTGTYDSLFESDEFKRVVRGLGGDESEDILCRTCEISGPA